MSLLCADRIFIILYCRRFPHARKLCWLGKEKSRSATQPWHGCGVCVEQAPAASGCTAVSAMIKQSPLREDYLAGLAQDQVVSALDGIEGDWIWGATLLARDLARTGRLLIGSSIWLSCDEFIQAIVTRIVEKTTQAAAAPIIMTVMASSSELADPFTSSRTGSEPNCLRLYRL